jgi:hypothetical protein
MSNILRRLERLELNGDAMPPQIERRSVSQADLDALHDILFSGGPPLSELPAEEEQQLDALFDRAMEDLEETFRSRKS